MTYHDGLTLSEQARLDEAFPLPPPPPPIGVIKKVFGPADGSRWHRFWWHLTGREEWDDTGCGGCGRFDC